LYFPLNAYGIWGIQLSICVPLISAGLIVFLVIIRWNVAGIKTSKNERRSDFVVRREAKCFTLISMGNSWVIA